ncbi:glutamine synthetase [Aeromicrobium endophyticum]|uniref:Glutamine synthetase n=2 Tax=Aeromicrobium endophyticum TaxID=2292704 RepID=A0A371NYW4_9ACTN|nr:glutamine synthetase [Aeromicrobium endophyticum]
MADAMNDYVIDPADLVDLGYHTVVVASPDLQGRLVGRRVPAESFDRILRDGVEVCTCVYAWDLTQDLALVEADVFPLCGMHNGVPDVTFRPDLTTLRPAAWLDGIAICLADPWDAAKQQFLPLSPRVILRDQIERFGELGLRAKMGTELEFYLFRNDPRELRQAGFRGLEPTTIVPADFMIHEGNTYEPFFRKLRSDLKASGIEMEAAQSEWGTGQWEMTFRYGDPLEMADRHALYKLAVRDSAAAAGMSATFMAKPLNAGQPGSSCHVHFSVLDADGASAFWDDASPAHLGDRMLSAIGGVLQEVPTFMAWYAPTVNSYRRANSSDVAGWGRTWGLDNRTTSVRVVGHKPEDIRFEFRLPGADTNPYLTLSALLASARQGIEQGIEPPAMTEGNGYESPVDEQVPLHLGEASAAFASSPFARSELGDEVVDHFRILLDHEWRTFLATVNDWDLDRYFDRI